MDYQYVGIEEKINGLINRIGQLEAEHYSNEIYALEAEVLGLDKEVEAFERKNEGIEKRIAALQAKVEELSELAPDSEEESDSKV